MAQQKGINTKYPPEVKAECQRRYLLGERPHDIAQDFKQYDMTAQTISSWAHSGKWRKQHKIKLEALADNFVEEIRTATKLSFDLYIGILNKTIKATVSEQLQAANGIMGINGLKQQTINNKKPIVEPEEFDNISKKYGLSVIPPSN